MPFPRKSVLTASGLIALVLIGISLFLSLRDETHWMPPEDNLIGRWERLDTSPNGDTIEFAWENKAEGTIMCLVLAEVLGTYFYRVEGSELVPISIGGTSEGPPYRFGFDNGNTLVLMLGDESLHYRRVLSKPDRETQDDVERSSRR